MEKKIKYLKVVQNSFIPYFVNNIDCCCLPDLLMKEVYEDGSEDFVFLPYFEFPKIDKAGKYIVKLYRNKNDKEHYIDYEIKVYDTLSEAYKYEKDKRGLQ